MSENAASEETTPTAPPADAAGAIPPVPPLPAAAAASASPPVPPYAAGSVAARFPAAPPAEHPTELYPTLPYGSPPGQGYAAPGYGAQGYGVPQASPAPQAYAPPTGYAPPPQGYGPYVPSSAPERVAGGPGLGIVSLVLALLAAVGATILGSVAGFNIGVGTGREIALQPMDIDFDWSILTPVRGWVLTGELAFWAGTGLGIWAIVQSIVAIVRNRGRGWGIAALIVALLGPILFAIGVQAFLAAGFASGATSGG